MVEFHFGTRIRGKKACKTMADNRNISIRNKRATFDYEILDTYIAGIVLSGTEIKSLRPGKASLVDCEC